MCSRAAWITRAYHSWRKPHLLIQTENDMFTRDCATTTTQLCHQEPHKSRSIPRDCGDSQEGETAEGKEQDWQQTMGFRGHSSAMSSLHDLGWSSKPSQPHMYKTGEWYFSGSALLWGQNIVFRSLKKPQHKVLNTCEYFACSVFRFIHGKQGKCEWVGRVSH